MTRQPILDMRPEGAMLVLELPGVESTERSSARSVSVRVARTRIYPMARILFVEVETTQVVTK